MRLIIFMVLVIFSCGLRKKNLITDSDFEVHFQKSFHNDLVGLKLNECGVFENTNLTSDKIVDFTYLIVKVRKDGKKSKIDFKDQHIICDEILNKIKLEVFLNGKKQLFYFELKNGKYIGISKAIDGTLIMTQQSIVFEYD